MQVKRRWAELTIQNDPFFVDPEFEQLNFDFIGSLDWPSNPVFVDVGGHQGIWATFLALLRPAGLVYTFEPHPNNVNYLLGNLRSTGIGNVLVAPVGLSSVDGPATLRCWDASRKAGATGNHQFTVGDLPHYEIAARTRRLDAYGLGRLDFIKIDVEHWELEVLKGAVETLTRCKPWLLIETHDDKLVEPLKELLEPLGYTCERQKILSVPSLNLHSDYLWCVLS